MLIKSEIKSVKVSYVETKQKVIKIPSFRIPVQRIKIGVLIILNLSLILFLTSFDQRVEKFDPAIHVLVPQDTNKIITIVKAEFKPQEEKTSLASSKTIPITDIIPLTKNNKKVLDFICSNEFLKRAYENQNLTGLLVATAIVQKGVESAWNKSSLCSKTKNYGNIKCFKKHKHGNGECVRAYDKIEKSNDYYVKVDTNWKGWTLYRTLLNKRYSKATIQDNVYDQLVWLKKKRYATDKDYVEKLWSVTKQYHLLKLQQYIDEGYTITTMNGKFVLLQQ